MEYALAQYHIWELLESHKARHGSYPTRLTVDDDVWQGLTRQMHLHAGATSVNIPLPREMFTASDLMLGVFAQPTPARADSQAMIMKREDKA